MGTTKKYTEKGWKKDANDAWNKLGLLYIIEKTWLGLTRVFAVTNDVSLLVRHSIRLHQS